MYIRLSDTDRKRLGLDEWVYWENARFTNREARLIERAEPHGPGMSPDDWIEALRGEPVEENGVPVLDEKTGEAIRRPVAATMDVVVWLALRRIPVGVPWSEFEYDRNGLVIRSDRDHEAGEESDADEEPGKEEPEPDPVEESVTPT